jgi:hypothetical protein
MLAAWNATRWVLSIAVAALCAASTVTAGCDESIDGRARCTSLLGNATRDWHGGEVAIPILIGVVCGAVVWWLLGAAFRLWVTASERVRETGDI